MLSGMDFVIIAAAIAVGGLADKLLGTAYVVLVYKYRERKRAKVGTPDADAMIAMFRERFAQQESNDGEQAEA